MNFRKPQPIQLVIADSYKFCEVLRPRLEARTEYRVIGEASDGVEAVKLVRQLNPDILLLCPRLLLQSGFDVLYELNTPANATPVRVIWYEVDIRESEIVKAMQLGARGVVLKQDGMQVLLKAIQTVMAGEYWVLREPLPNLEHLRTLLQLRHEEKRQKLFGLTPREREIVSAVVAGYSNRKIAEYFKISEDIVKHLLRHILDELGFSIRWDLFVFAVNQGFPPLEVPPADSPHKPTA